MKKIALLPGDGIGPEVLKQGKKVLEKSINLEVPDFQYFNFVQENISYQIRQTFRLHKRSRESSQQITHILILFYPFVKIPFPIMFPCLLYIYGT